MFEHLHYQVRNDVEHDQTYRSAESLWGQRDADAYQKWYRLRMAPQAAMLRRTFSKDLEWVFSKF
jgi:hypothetical protein